MTERRVIGRILSLGFPLPGPRVDNYTFISAPAFFDYDALVVNPLALSDVIEGIVAGTTEAATFAGCPVRNVPRDAGDVALGDVLLRRRDEAGALLERGGVVIAFAVPSVVHRGIEGIDALASWYWLGEPPALVPSEGTGAVIVDYQHPMAAFVQSQLSNIVYRAAIDRAGGDAVPRGGVFVQSRGGAAIGAELPCGPGRLVLLPALKAAPSGDARYRMSELFQAGVRRLLGAMAEGRAPGWISQHGLPGLAESEAAAGEARGVADAARSALAEAEAHRDERARYQALLWQEGPGGLDPVVLDALRLIGCDVYDRTPDALQVRAEGVSLVLEIEASEHAVDLAAHYRLRQRIEAAISRRVETPRGLLLINGHRLIAPSQRPPQASDALRAAAETMRYAIATTSGLFEAVVAKLNGDEEAVAAYRGRLVTEHGLLA